MRSSQITRGLRKATETQYKHEHTHNHPSTYTEIRSLILGLNLNITVKTRIQSHICCSLFIVLEIKAVKLKSFCLFRNQIDSFRDIVMVGS